jgi:sugar/nucleoside kinase (ribokinase family)
MSIFSNLFGKKQLDVLSIGDVFIDTFIAMDGDGTVANANTDHATLTIPWGDKLPYEKATAIAGVGNAGNAAVAVARLGAQSGLLAIVGNDPDGDKILAQYRKEKLVMDFLKRDANLPTNNAYVLQEGPERTILVHQNPYDYEVPKKLLAQFSPKWIYLTSLGKTTLQFHHDLAAWLNEHPETKLAFQPGTFQMQLGKDALADIYKRSDAFFCNKEESQRILGTGSDDYQTLHASMRALGCKIVVITDGPNGITFSETNDAIYHLPMYPDPKPPVSRTGAGDATSSTITTALALGLPLQEAVLWGPINSMNVVQAVGAQTNLATREQILQSIKNAPADYKATKIS